MLTLHCRHRTYSLKPEDFGLSRYIDITSRLIGWHAVSVRPVIERKDPTHRSRRQVKSRVEQLGLVLTDEQVKDVTLSIKRLADVKTQSIEDVDTVLRVCKSNLVSL